MKTRTSVCAFLLVLMAVLTAAAPSSALNAISIGEAKKLPPLTLARIEDAVVTAGQGVAPGGVFVESNDQCAGLRVITDAKLEVGHHATLTGYLQRVDGEWQMIGTSVTDVAVGKPVTPLGMTGKAFACDPTQLLDYSGLNPTGLLVRVWGQTTGVIAGRNIIYINDGSNYMDGISSYYGIRVQLPAGVNLMDYTGFTGVTGVARVEKHIFAYGGSINGRDYPAGAVVYVPTIYAVVNGNAPGPDPEPFPTVYDGIPTITWDPSLYTSKSIVEMQIIRDIATEGAKPVKVLTDYSEICLGYTKLTGLYGNPDEFTTVNYRQLASSPSDDPGTSMSRTIPGEAFGYQHTYQTRIIYKEATGNLWEGRPTYRYWYSPLSAPILATAIEPVGNYDVLYPYYDPNWAPPELYLSDLLMGMANFEWNRKDGADIYRITVEPVVPGTAGTWTSSTIYAAGPTVYLPSDQRAMLANMLMNTAADYTMIRWRVYCRHSSDTNPAWVQGEENLFTIGALPPAMP